jgi:hypothetical protein
MGSLRIVRPCDEDWDAMRPTGRGRFCTRCHREVLDLTDRSARDAEASVRGGQCVRIARAESPCPAARARLAAWALAAGGAVAVTTCLTGCVDAYAVGRERAHYASVAGCAGTLAPPTAAELAPTAVAEPEDGPPPTDICSVVPDAPQCQMGDWWHAPGDAVIESGPMHLRASCNERPSTAFVTGQFVVQPWPELRRHLLSRPSDYPEGMDVVVAGVAADGVDAMSVRRMAHGMLDPLESCYKRHVDDEARTAPQGRLFLTARVADDGTLGDVHVEESSALPDDLVACAMSHMRAARVAAPHEDLASVEVDLRFVYRTLPSR